MNVASITTVPPAVATPPAAAPTAAPRAPEQVGRQLVGMSITDARAAVDQLGLSFRVSVENGEPQILTMDWQPTRINVGIEGDTITSFEGLG